MAGCGFGFSFIGGYYTHLGTIYTPGTAGRNVWEKYSSSTGRRDKKIMVNKG